MNYETVTIQDCVEMYELKGQAVIISGGEVIGFVKESS